MWQIDWVDVVGGTTCPFSQRLGEQPSETFGSVGLGRNHLLVEGSLPEFKYVQVKCRNAFLLMDVCLVLNGESVVFLSVNGSLFAFFLIGKLPSFSSPVTTAHTVLLVLRHYIISAESPASSARLLSF